ncbi:MAG: DUF2892 domain-containing protein [Candidatus Aegiribacteria sp.]
MKGDVGIFKKNEGTLDRIIRVCIAVIIGLLYLTGVIGGTAAIVLGIVAIALLITGIVGFCSLYVPFGISTRKSDRNRP